jgi:hypothetical protein
MQWHFTAVKLWGLFKCKPFGAEVIAWLCTWHTAVARSGRIAADGTVSASSPMATILNGLYSFAKNSSRTGFIWTTVLAKVSRRDEHLIAVKVFLSATCSTAHWVNSSESESYVTTGGQSASLSWYKALIRGLRPDFYFRTEYVWQLRSWFRGAPSLTKGRVCLLYVPRSLSRVLVPWDLQPYFTVSDLRLPFSSPPTTHRVTVEVFDPASTRVNWTLLYNHFARTTQKTAYCWKGVFTAPLHSNGSYSIVACVLVAAEIYLPSRCLAMNAYLTSLFRLSGVMSQYHRPI